MPPPPIAFLSYVRFDDKPDGRITELRKRLSIELQQQTTEEFPIFQDINDIEWGQQWRRAIEGTLDIVTFLIAIITPNFFKSQPCRDELDRFLKHEKALGRDDLVLPVYYIESSVFNNARQPDADPLATILADHNYVDWRELRTASFTSAQVAGMIETMAKRIVKALGRGGPGASPAAAKPAAPSPSAENLERLEAAASLEFPRSPTAKTEPPTIIVDAMYRGDYPTLTEALTAAIPGTRIIVRPGLYRESIVIDKPIEIIGDGDLGDIVVEATGEDTVLFQANMGRIANLTLRHAGGGVCVEIAQGRLDLEDCDITSQDSPCVMIRDGADPRLRRNRIHDGSFGITIVDNGQGTLEDNDIFGNKIGGVVITGPGKPTLRRNRITRNGLVAIRMRGGQGVFEDNDLRGNARGSWAISLESLGKVTSKGNLEEPPPKGFDALTLALTPNS
jgi:parallel beta-helix repeat protein